MPDPVPNDHISKMIIGLVRTGAPVAVTEITSEAGDFWLVVMTPDAYRKFEKRMVVDPRSLNPGDMNP